MSREKLIESLEEETRLKVESILARANVEAEKILSETSRDIEAKRKINLSNIKKAFDSKKDAFENDIKRDNTVEINIFKENLFSEFAVNLKDKLLNDSKLCEALLKNSYDEVLEAFRALHDDLDYEIFLNKNDKKTLNLKDAKVDDSLDGEVRLISNNGKIVYSSSSSHMITNILDENTKELKGILFGKS